MSGLAQKVESDSNKSESLSRDEKGYSSKEVGETVVAADDGIPSILITPAAERALVWKFDLRILPVLAVMYLFNSLDKSNLGNAKTAGLEKTLKLKGDQYNIILSVFFVPYVLTAPFLGILGKKLGPNRVLPCMMFAFGCFTVLFTAVMNFSGLLALRWFLGMSESAFFPLVIYYLTTYGPLSLVECDLIADSPKDSTAEENWPVVWRSFTLRRVLPLHFQAFSHSVSSISIQAPSPIGAISSSSKAAAQSASPYSHFGIFPDLPRKRDFFPRIKKILPIIV